MEAHLTTKSRLIVLVMTVFIAAVALANWLRPWSGERKSGVSFDDRMTRYYQLDLESKASMIKAEAGGDSKTQQPDIVIRLSGRIALEKELGAGVGVVRLRFALTPTLSLKEASDTGEFAGDLATLESLKQGIPLQINERGLITVTTDNVMGDRFAIQLLKQVAAAFQVCLPVKASLESWECEEQDGTGKYRANYELKQSSESGRLVHKVKSGYGALFPMGEGMSSPPLKGTLTGDSTALVDVNSGLPINVDGSEDARINLQFDGSEIQSFASTKFKINFEREELNTPRPSIGANGLGTSSDAGGSSTSLATGTENMRLRDAAKERFGEIDITELQRSFDMLRQSDARNKDLLEREFYDKLVGYVRQHETDHQSLLHTLVGRRADDPWLHQVLSALAYVGCDQCQTQLVKEVMARQSDPTFAADLLNLLTQPEHPGLEVEKALRNLTESSQPVVRDMAELGLGTVAYRLRDSDQGRSVAIAQQFTDKFRQSADFSTQSAALAVLGNVGNESLLQDLAPWIKSNDDGRREAAAKALRNLHSDGARTAVLELAADPTVAVRRSALQSLIQMPPSVSSIAPLIDRYRSDKVPVVRMAIVQDLARYLKDSLKAQETVRDAAKNDSDADVRLLAKNSLIMYGLE